MSKAAHSSIGSRPRQQRRSRVPARPWLAGGLGLVCLGAGVALALHYPIVPTLAAGLFLGFFALFLARPEAWLLVLPALLPVAGFALWTGWVTFEEIDLLVLAAAAGGYGRMVLRKPDAAQGATRATGGASALTALVLGLFGASTLLAMARGFEDAGGFSFGWFQGYHEPMNSLRLAKSFVWALLLLPLWRAEASRSPERAARHLGDGLVLGLAAASLATVWERLAFTDLMNFSADYRTTGLFWEMHVGGAALDGFLALTVPFVAWGLLRARTPLRWGAMAAAAALAGYACLTTFSRGVYLAVPVGLALLFGLQALQRRHDPAAIAGQPQPGQEAAAGGLLRSAGLLLVFGAGAAWMFPSSGYRGMLALLGAMALLLPLGSALQHLRASAGGWGIGLLGGAMLAGLAWSCAWLLPKGAYAAYVAGLAIAAVPLALLRRPRKGSRRALAAWALAGFVGVLAGVVLVAQHWGDAPGLRAAVPAALALLALAVPAGLARRPAWPAQLRWQASMVAAMGLLAGFVGVLGGGVYMAERFSTGEQDLQGRLRHWEEGLAMLQTPADWAFGKGLGRYPSSHFFAPSTAERPGDYRLAHEGGNAFLVLTGGQHVNGWGEIFRMSQRIALPVRPVVVTAQVRSAMTVVLHVEVCEKHLLYSAGCLIGQTQVAAKRGEWQKISVELKGDGIARGLWFAPKLLVFSVAMETRGGVADIDDLALSDGNGRALLANGDFSQDLAHWFSSSDRHHMPWHIKSMFMNVLFDQGIAGALLWLALSGGALWRLCLGRARGHPLAPPLAAALVGFGLVGLFDSLLDVPRDALLYYLLALLGLVLPRPAPASPPAAAGSAAAAPPATGRAPATALLLAAAIGLAWLVPAADVHAQPAAASSVLRVGPTRTIKTIAEAARLVGVGGIVEVDAGEYRGDVAVWLKDGVTVRANGGRVRLLAQGAAAEGKGIWVVRARDMRVEGFDFEGALVPSRNGAGIRFEQGSLLVRDCRFRYNEMGLLTNNDPASMLTVENSEFAYNQRPDGHNHNLYVGQIAQLSVSGSYFHHARTGHLLKSRAAVNHIFYNRLTDEAGGTASYELEFPNGGVAHVVGNLVEQGTQTENVHVVSFGAEGYKWPRNELHLANNTLVDRLPQGGVFLRVAPGGGTVVHAVNNLLVGRASPDAVNGPGSRNNLLAELADFVDAGALDYRLRAGSPLAGRAVDPGEADGRSLRPEREYVHSRGSRALAAPAHNPGALQTLGPPAGTH